ncbi:MAG: DinB family protein [Phycisphaerales bacterium]
MRTQDAIAEFILMSKPGTARYLAGFDDTSHTRQGPHLPNHVAWNLGHCALTMHRVCEKADGVGPPDADFISGGTRGDGGRFATESVAFGSSPTADPGAYPPLARCVEIYHSAIDRTAAAARALPDARLEEVVVWGPIQTPLFLLFLRMGFHNGMHVGQIADLRRAFGFRSIFA